MPQYPTHPRFLGKGFCFTVIAVALSFGMLSCFRENAQTPESKDAPFRPAEEFYAMRDYPVFRPDIRAYTAAIAEARQSACLRIGFS